MYFVLLSANYHKGKSANKANNQTINKHTIQKQYNYNIMPLILLLLIIITVSTNDKKGTQILICEIL